jgi:hypothetical protein
VDGETANTMTHINKKTTARRMMTKLEIKYHTPIFQSKAWEERKDNKATRARNREISAQYRKEKKKELLKKSK